VGRFQKQILVLFSCGIFLFTGHFSGHARAETIADKTPSDVFYSALQLKKKIILLREQRNVHNRPWGVSPDQQKNKKPRHVYQKALEILHKINRYRLIYNLGEIYVPDYPSRHVTPNEVYMLMERILAEVDILLGAHEIDYIFPVVGKTPSDVYKELSEISVAFDALLGVRGFTPADNYALAEDVISILEFLRETQGLENVEPLDAEEDLTGKHPNHSLQESYLLLDDIQHMQRKLWMTNRVQVPTMEQRVIAASEVYDSLGVIIAELYYILYHLGYNFRYEPHEPQSGKTSSDVIERMRYARALMPDFSASMDFKFRDRSLLTKTPNHVYALTENIIQKLENYMDEQSIAREQISLPTVKNLQPKHVFGRSIECLRQIKDLRRSAKAGEITVPRFPLRKITPDEVYGVVERIEYEIGILYDISVDELESLPVYQDRTPNDVYKNVWHISKLLKILSNNPVSLEEILAEAQGLYEETVLILQQLDFPMPAIAADEVVEKKDSTAQAIASQLQDLDELIDMMERYAGMYNRAEINVDGANDYTNLENLYDPIRLLHGRLEMLKIELGITEKISPRESNHQENIERVDISHALENTKRVLESLLYQRTSP
jgi:hypothetical protein